MSEHIQQTFETAFSRLEKILEEMNEGEASLDNALKLYEEADQLLVQCSKRLSEAETRIETLIKNREGKLALDQDGRPRSAPLDPEDGIA